MTNTALEKWMAALSLTLVGVSQSGAQTAAEMCERAYANNVADTTLVSRRSAVEQEIFNQHCELNGSVKKGSVAFGFKIPIEGVPVEAHASQSNSTQREQQFCKEFQSKLTTYDSLFSYDRQINVDALRALNQCLEIAAKGVQVSHSISWPKSVLIDVAFDGSKSIVIVRNAVYDESAGECYFSGTPIKGKKDLIRPGTTPARTFKTTFSVTCDRRPLQVEGDIAHFPALTVILDTNVGQYTAEMPADEVYGWQAGRAAKERYARLESELRAAKAERDVLDGKVKGFTPRLSSVTQTNEGSPQSESGEMVGCPQKGNSLTAYVQEKCGSGNVARSWLVKRIPDGLCGKSVYAYTCSPF